MTDHENLEPIEEETPEAVEPEETDGEERDEEYRQSRRQKGPGVEGYDPDTDPLIPNSYLLDVVKAELRLSDEKSSPTWDALYDEWCKANPEVDEDAELVEDEGDES